MPTESSEAHYFRTGSLLIQGKHHNEISLGCQDACYIDRRDASDVIVAIVCDGCSTTDFGFTRNQVGAVLGSHYFGKYLATLLEKYSRKNDAPFFEKMLQITTKQMTSFFIKMLNSMNLSSPSDEWDRFIADKLLFTILGFAVIKERYWIFGLGNGSYGINNKTRIINPSDQSSNYFGQLLLLKKNQLSFPSVQIHDFGESKDIKHIWIASDGIYDILSSERGKESFREFLDDEFTCSTNTKGEDTTIQAFRRKMFNQNKRHLSDDLTIAIAKASVGMD